MIQISHIRKKCVGCNFCMEMDPGHWRISRSDGKANLVGSREKKGNYILNLTLEQLDLQQRVATGCPARCIRVKQVS